MQQPSVTQVQVKRSPQLRIQSIPQTFQHSNQQQPFKPSLTQKKFRNSVIRQNSSPCGVLSSSVVFPSLRANENSKSEHLNPTETRLKVPSVQPSFSNKSRIQSEKVIVGRPQEFPTNQTVEISLKNYVSPIFCSTLQEFKYKGNLKRLLNLKPKTQYNSVASPNKRQENENHAYQIGEFQSVVGQEQKNLQRNQAEQQFQHNETINPKNNVGKQQDDISLISYFLKSQNYILHKKQTNLIKDQKQNPFGFCFHPENQKPIIPLYISPICQNNSSSSQLTNIPQKRPYSVLSPKKQPKRTVKMVAEGILDQELSNWEKNLIQSNPKTRNNLVPYGNVRKNNFTINLPFDKNH